MFDEYLNLSKDYSEIYLRSFLSGLLIFKTMLKLSHVVNNSAYKDSLYKLCVLATNQGVSEKILSQENVFNNSFSLVLKEPQGTKL